MGGRSPERAWRGWELSRGARRFLSSLPPSYALQREGYRVAVHHGSPRGDRDGICPARVDFEVAQVLLAEACADALVLGHTHIAFDIEVAGRGLIVNPAAVLRAPAPGADNPPATGTYGVLELPGCRFSAYSVNDGREVEVDRRRLDPGGPPGRSIGVVS